MQSVLSPTVGRLSDVIDRKYLASIPPLIAFIGAVVSAKATSIAMLIGGGILIGTTLATISIVQAIPSEILPLKHRALANGFAYMGGAVGGMFVSILYKALITTRSIANIFVSYIVQVVSLQELLQRSLLVDGEIFSGSKQVYTLLRLPDY